MKKAVILFNLGGPDKLENVQPFLFNLFNDPAILNLPRFIRYPLAKLIANRRTPTAKKIYKELGGSSPILKLTNEQASALELKLNQEDDLSEYKCFVVMRCWHPRAENVVKEVISFNPEEVILMPLYPQYSAATSGSSIKEWNDICKKNNFRVKTSTICCYPTDQNFVKAHKVPVICFPREIKNYEEYCKIIKPDVINIDYKTSPEKIIKKTDIVVQGGLDPKVLLTDKEKLKIEAKRYLDIFKDHPYIFNLGHGVLPKTNPQMLDYLIKFVKGYY